MEIKHMIIKMKDMQKFNEYINNNLLKGKMHFANEIFPLMQDFSDLPLLSNLNVFYLCRLYNFTWNQHFRQDKSC